MLFLNVKNFALYFRFKWQHYSLQSEWQQIINPNIIHELERKNWYIRHKRTLEQLSNVYKAFGVLHLLNLSLCFVFHQIVSDVSRSESDLVAFVFVRALNMLLFTLPFFIYIWIELKTPHFDDCFFIHWESRAEAKLTALLIFIFLCTDIATALQGELTLLTVLTSSSLRAFMITLFALVFVSRFMVLCKNDPNQAHACYNAHAAGNVLTLSLSDQSSQVKLDNILSCEDTLNLLMQHLASEYSLELLLSYIEFDQFQKYTIRQLNQFLQMHVFGTGSVGSSQPLSEDVPKMRIRQSDVDRIDDIGGHDEHAAQCADVACVGGSERDVNVDGKTP